MLEESPQVVGGDESHLFVALYSRLSGGKRGEDRTRAVLERYDHRKAKAASLGDTGPHTWVQREALAEMLGKAASGNLNGDDAAHFVLGRILDDYMKAHRGVDGRVLVEKTPAHLQYADRILDWWPGARVVELIRDGRDVCASLEHKSAVRDWATSERAEQIRQWVDAVRLGERLRAQPSAAGRWLTVRYEDFSREPEREVARLYDFAGLPCDPVTIASVAAATHIGQAARPGNDHHVRKGKIGGWRDDFSDADEQLFMAEAGETLARLGYDR